MSGPVLQSRFLVDLAHCALTQRSKAASDFHLTTYPGVSGSFFLLGLPDVVLAALLESRRRIFVRLETIERVEQPLRSNLRRGVGVETNAKYVKKE